jgi:hypothetical protein
MSPRSSSSIPIVPVRRYSVIFFAVDVPMPLRRAISAGSRVERSTAAAPIVAAARS